MGDEMDDEMDDEKGRQPSSHRAGHQMTHGRTLPVPSRLSNVLPKSHDTFQDANSEHENLHI
jgi:hypothetical protein